MSKSVKMIIGVVAAVAIPFAAPALAAMVSASTAFGGALAAGASALGTTATSGLIGAGLGAASAAATGGDIGKGALFGGLGGGLGGYASAAKAAQAGQAATQATQAGQAAIQTTAPVGTGTVLAATPEAAAGGLSGSFTPAAGAGIMQAAPGQTGGALAGLGTSGSSAIQFGGGVSVPTTVAPAANPSFGSRMVSGVKDAWNTATTPENLANTAMSGAKYLTGSALAGSGMSSADEAMMREQRQELKRAQEVNEAATAARMEQGLKLTREADYYDPEYMGLQRARQAQLRGARIKQAGVRGLDTSNRQAENRRYDLGTSRETGTGYDQGYQSGVQQRTSTRAAGVGLLPTSYPTTNAQYAGLALESKVAEDRRRQRARDIGNLFGDFSGQRQTDPKQLGG
jgi:hypothetical protein